jgi:hypothetical protein
VPLTIRKGGIRRHCTSPSKYRNGVVAPCLLRPYTLRGSVRCLYHPIHTSHGEHPVLTRSLRPADIFAIIPLHQEPVFSSTSTGHGRPIWLLDPLDMIPSVFELSTSEVGLVEYVRLLLFTIVLRVTCSSMVAYPSKIHSLLSSTSAMAAWGFSCPSTEPGSAILVEKICGKCHDGLRCRRQSSRRTLQLIYLAKCDIQLIPS